MLFHPEVMTVEMLAQKIRKIPNWPQEGVLFHDITPVLQSPEYFRLLVDLLTYRYMTQDIDVVAGLDARGFIHRPPPACTAKQGGVANRNKRRTPKTPTSQT